MGRRVSGQVEPAVSATGSQELIPARAIKQRERFHRTSTPSIFGFTGGARLRREDEGWCSLSLHWPGLCCLIDQTACAYACAYLTNHEVASCILRRIANQGRLEASVMVGISAGGNLTH